MRKVLVKTSKEYEVFIGYNSLSILPNLIKDNVDKIFVITQKKVPVSSINKLLNCQIIYVPDSERAKTIKTLQVVAKTMLDNHASRKSLIIAYGGGSVTDLAGYLAASFMRGIKYINVATTLTAQIDAAIGGKTGVNLSTGEKNILGVFYHPEAVICDLDFLKTLKRTQVLDGLGEMAKYELIGIKGLFEKSKEEQVFECVKYKASIVQKDEKEQTGLRSILNYGHTLAHALEAYAKRHRKKITHGQAVAIGICFEGYIAFKLGRIDKEMLLHHYDLLSKYQLPTRIPFNIDENEIINLMTIDKKTKANQLTLVLPGKAGFELISGINKNLAKTALKEISKVN
jgi:5-deoxy-5-amino-3-dehydroquinate synthase